MEIQDAEPVNLKYQLKMFVIWVELDEISICLQWIKEVQNIVNFNVWQSFPGKWQNRNPNAEYVNICTQWIYEIKINLDHKIIFIIIINILHYQNNNCKMIPVNTKLTLA